MVSKIGKILLIVLGVPGLIFVGLVIYEMTIGLPESPPGVLPPEPPSEEAKKPALCFFTRDPVETWPNETVSDPPIGNVELIKTVYIETYDVFGSDLYEVVDSINKSGLTSRLNYTAVAGVEAKIDTKVWRTNTAAGCILTSAEVNFDARVVLPNWVDKASASDQDQKMWDLYQKFTKQHEQGHINLALKAARELQAELAQLKPAPSCQELTGKIKTLQTAARQKRTQTENDYDQRTNRGSTQMPHEQNQTRYVFPFTCNWEEIKI